MSKTHVTLNISTTEEGEFANSSSTTIQTDSLEELHRMLDLAGIPGAYMNAPMVSNPGAPENIEVSEPAAIGVEEQETYKPSADLKVRNPDHKLNNPRFADNSLEEAEIADQMGTEDIVDMYFNFLAVSDHEEAIARVADEIGIRGEQVARIIQKHANSFAEDVSEDFADYNQVEPREEAPLAKSFKDYVSDLGAEREVQHATKKWTVRVEWMDSAYNSRFEEEVVAAGTAKEAQQAVIGMLKIENGGSLNLIDSEAEEFIGEANELTIDAKTGAVEGPYKDNLDPESAAHYIQQYPDGILQNDVFETYSFIFLNAYGEWKFYHSVRNAVENWDWSDDVQDIIDSFNGDEIDTKNFMSGFWYEPASDFFPQVFHKEGMAMWYKLRGEESQKQLESEVDEAYGVNYNRRTGRMTDKSGYDHILALLPCPGMFNVDSLGGNEYFGSDLQNGSASVVCISIETGDKPRLTFAITSGGVNEYRPGQSVLTYHDQTGKERPGTIVTAFTGKEWSTPEGREQVKRAMANGGMDPKRKYSVRVFK